MKRAGFFSGKAFSVCIALVMVLVLSVTAMPQEVMAASSKPAKVVIKSAKVSGTNIVLTWKAAKRASKYQVALRTQKTGWRYKKTVKKTSANKKKYSGSNYKLKASGKYYKVYKKGLVYSYKTLKTLKKKTYTYTGGKAGSTYVFVVRGVKGKKKGSWSKAVTCKIPVAVETAKPAESKPAEASKPSSEGPKPTAAPSKTESTAQSETEGILSDNNPNAEGILGTEGRTTVDGTIPEDETAKAYLNKTTAKVTNGETTAFTLKNYSGTDNVSWKSSNTSVAKVSKISGTKNVTATIKCVAESGTATITATVGGKSFKATVTARPKTVLSSTAITVTKGYTASVTLNNYYGTTDVTWSSSNTKIATVSSTSGTHKTKAVIKAVAASGSCTVTAKAGSKSYKVTVTAKDVPSIKEGNLTLPIGSTQKLTVQNYTGTPTWSSSKTSVATVSSKGVVAVKASSGKTTITANCGGKKASCVITARQKTPEEATTYVKKTYKFGGKAMVKAEVPKGWTMSVLGITSTTCDPIVQIIDPTGKYGIYQRLTMPAVKSKQAQEYWKKYAGIDVIYPIPVSGYNKKGYDAAGLFRGIVTYNGLKSFAVEKKVSKTAYGSDVIAARATDKKGTKLRFLFSGQVLDTGSYRVVYKGTALNALTTASTSVDVWFLTCLDVMYLQAPYNEFADWLPVLAHSFASIEYTEDCVKKYVDQSDTAKELIRETSEKFNTQTEKMVNDFLKYINS